MNDEATLVISSAIETYLKTLDEDFETAYENVNFKPSDNPFQVPTFLFAEPDDLGYRDSPYILRGIFTNTLAYPTNEGAGNAQTKAEQVKAYFYRGLSLPTPNFNIIFDRTPEITGGAVEEDRYIIRVRCRFFAHIDAANGAI